MSQEREFPFGFFCDGVCVCAAHTRPRGSSGMVLLDFWGEFLSVLSPAPNVSDVCVFSNGVFNPYTCVSDDYLSMVITKPSAPTRNSL